jgi:dolichol-phosphate mannosyltransferase
MTVSEPRLVLEDPALHVQRAPATLVLPTFEEAGNILEVLSRLRLSAPNLDVIVVDDDSADGTADLAFRFGEEFGGVSVVRRDVRTGLGDAYRCGFRLALDLGYEFVAQMDADLSHPPEMVVHLLRKATRADLVIGSRYVVGGSTVGWNRRRRWLSRAGNRYAAFMLQLPITDITSGFRVFRAEAVRKYGVLDTSSTGYAFQIETTTRVFKGGGSVCEVPIAFADRVHGTSKLSWPIIAEALARVTREGIRSRVLDRAASSPVGSSRETRR